LAPAGSAFPGDANAQGLAAGFINFESGFSKLEVASDSLLLNMLPSPKN
jgi:hypothetical protein